MLNSTNRTLLSSTDEVAKGFLLKRKDFLGVDELAHSHPNRTYYYRKHLDLDEIIETCSRKLMVSFIESNTLLL